MPTIDVRVVQSQRHIGLHRDGRLVRAYLGVSIDSRGDLNRRTVSRHSAMGSVGVHKDKNQQGCEDTHGDGVAHDYLPPFANAWTPKPMVPSP